jgi:hypothetical protein
MCSFVVNYYLSFSHGGIDQESCHGVFSPNRLIQILLAIKIFSSTKEFFCRCFVDWDEKSKMFGESEYLPFQCLDYEFDYDYVVIIPLDQILAHIFEHL